MACFVRFNRAFSYRVRRRDGSLTTEFRVYPAGWTILVPEAHAVMAEGLGAGARVPRELVDRSNSRTVARPEKLRAR